MKGNTADRWPSKTLGELCRIELGSTPARRNPSLWDTDKKTENIWLSIADLPQNLHAVASNSKEYVSDLAAQSMKLIPEGTLMVSFKLTLGRLAYAGCDLFSNEAIASLYDIDQQAISKEFLYWVLTAFDWDKAAEGDQKVKGKTLNKAKLKKIPIPLPPLEEQRRIVAVLDEAFEGLAQARAHTVGNLQNSRELFGNYREKYLDPTTRDGWSSVKLDQIMDIKHGFAFKSAFFEDEGQYAVLTPGNYYETGGFKDRGEKQRYYSGEFPSKFILKKDDLLVAMTEQAPGLLGSCMIVPEDDRFLHNQRLGLITPKNGVSWSAEYFAQAFNLKAFRKGLSDTCSGATVRHTSPKRILAESIPYCKDVAQLDLAATHLSEREKDCRLMEKSYRAKVKDLDDLRQSLLQKAFAGELT